MKEVYFSHARIALKYGLQMVGLRQGSCVLIPDFICEAVLQPLYDLNFLVKFYKTDDSLKPDYKSLEKQIIFDNAKAVMMVHYFGQPQDIEFFLHMSRKNKIILIEDNAHGFSGTYDNKILGTFGDIGISSPRKTLNSELGGILYVDGKFISPPKKYPNAAKSSAFKSIAKYNLSKWPLLNSYAYKILGKNSIIENPYNFNEDYVHGSKADWYSSYLINNVEINRLNNKISQSRRSKWKAVHELTLALGAKPIFDNVDEGSCPWAYPCYLFENDKKINFVKTLKNKNYHIFSWPSLPKNNNKIDQSMLNRWKSLFCVSLTGR